MPTTEAAGISPGTVEKTKLEKGSEDYNLFHNLIQTVPGFLSLTATNVKQQFPQFKEYSTGIINTALHNAKRTYKRREAATKGKTKEDEAEKSTEAEKSKYLTRRTLCI